ncbi:terminase small subunit [Empedobacter brevis]|uniref:terminase small subunit n=1 Tax=Empedobacter brevis TaxID=247 RepID=UPI003342BC30
MAAPKGNKYAEGNKGGAPSFYEDPEILEQKVIEYFEWCKGEYEEREGTRTETRGKGKAAITTTETYSFMLCLREPETPSITGLAIHLGFKSKDSLYDYAKKEEFSDSIKKGLLQIENKYERGLWNDKPTGVIFALKNMGWSDKKEVDHTTKGESINVIQLGKGINPEG